MLGCPLQAVSPRPQFLWQHSKHPWPQQHCLHTVHSYITSCFSTSAGLVSCVNQRHLLVNYLHDVKDILQIYELSTGRFVRDLPLDVGTVAGVSCKKKHSEFFYKFTSFTTPGRSVFQRLCSSTRWLSACITIACDLCCSLQVSFTTVTWVTQTQSLKSSERWRWKASSKKTFRPAR